MMGPFRKLFTDKLFKRPLFEPVKGDNGRQRAAASINITLIFLLITSIVVAIASVATVRVLTPEVFFGRLATFLSIGVFGFLLYLSRRGYITVVASIFIIFMFILVTTMLVNSGSIRNTDVTVYFLVIVIAGLLIGPRAVIATGLASTVAISVIYVLENMGLLTNFAYRSNEVSSIDFFILVVVFCTSTILMYRTVVSIQREAHLAQNSARSLQHQTIRLLELNKEIKNREQTLRAILSEIPDIIFRAKLHGDWLDIHNAEFLLGSDFQNDQNNSTTNRRFMDHFKKLIPLIEEALETGEIQRLDFQFESEMMLHELEARIIPSSIDEVVGIIRDVTKERQIEETIRQAQKLDSVGMLAGGVAHDFNNWLTGVITQLTLAKKKLERLNESQESPHDPEFDIIDRHLNKAKDASLQAAVLTHQLLTYAGRRTLKAEIIDLNKFVLNNIDLIKIAMRKKVDVQVDFYPTSLFIRCEPAQIQQVMMNLIINGSDAIEDDKLDGRVSVSTSTIEVRHDDLNPVFVAGKRLPLGQYAQLIVSDTGKGMDSETQSRIFDPFFSTKSNGRGLGLSSTLGIISSHNGGLHVESTVDVGTTFTVYLPLVDNPALKSPLDCPADLAGVEGASLLVIDDEAFVREAVIDLCHSENIKVFEAKNGFEGVNVYNERQTEIDVLLVDIQMPGMNGIDVWHAVKKINPEAKIILSSGFINDELRENLPDGPLLTKPWSSEDLLGTLHQYIG